MAYRGIVVAGAVAAAGAAAAKQGFSSFADGLAAAARSWSMSFAASLGGDLCGMFSPMAVSAGAGWFAEFCAWISLVYQLVTQ